MKRFLALCALLCLPLTALAAGSYAVLFKTQGTYQECAMRLCSRPPPSTTEAQGLSSGKALSKEAARFRKDDRGAAAELAALAEKKELAPRTALVVCLLLPDGDIVEDLARLLRREGADDLEVAALEPRAVREAFAPHRGRFAGRPEPAHGWTVTAGIRSGTLNQLPVIEDIDEEEDGVAHIIESAAAAGRLAVGGRVTGIIDWRRRLDHMQQHSGQHMLSDCSFANRRRADRSGRSLQQFKLMP